MSRHYRFEAARPDGRIVRGAVEADSAALAVDQVRRRRLEPVTVQPGSPPTARGHRAARADVALLCDSLADLLEAGVPLDRALAAAETMTTSRVRETLAEARVRLAEGHTLAEALAGLDPDIGGNVLPMLRAGERSGRLAAALRAAGDELTRQAELRSRIAHALAYPAVLAVAGATAIGVIGVVVVPQFARLLADLGQDLPASTRLLLAGTALGRRVGLPVAALLAVVAIGLRRWTRTSRGRLWLDARLVTLPLVGPLNFAFATSRALAALASALEAGAPLLAATDLAAEAVANLEVARRWRRVRERLALGESLAHAVAAEGAAVPLGARLLAMGEQGGRMAACAARGSTLVARVAERRLQTAVSLIEPVLILGFGGIVALVAAALLQAVYGLRPQL